MWESFAPWGCAPLCTCMQDFGPQQTRISRGEPAGGNQWCVLVGWHGLGSVPKEQNPDSGCSHSQNGVGSRGWPNVALPSSRRRRRFPLDQLLVHLHFCWITELAWGSVGGGMSPVSMASKCFCNAPALQLGKWAPAIIPISEMGNWGVGKLRTKLGLVMPSLFWGCASLNEGLGALQCGVWKARDLLFPLENRC